MTFRPRHAYPVAQWDEPPMPAASFAIGRLTPYLLTDGSVEFFAASDSIPAGAIEATVADSGDGTDEIVSPAVTTGRRPTQNTNGEVFLS